MAAMRNAARAVQREDQTLRMRRPPDEFVNLLSQSEPEFRSFVETFEKHPAFERLVNEGAIARVRLQGRIPREKYADYMDRALVDWLRDHQITEKTDWERDFLGLDALDRVPQLAEKYAVAPGPLIRFLRYIRASTQGHINGNWVEMAGKTDAPAASELAIDNAANTERVDLTDIIEITREFVNRYEVSEHDFLEVVLGGGADANEVAARFGCSLLEAEEVLEAADRVYLVQSYEEAGAKSRPQPSFSTQSQVSGSDAPVAWVEIIDDKPSIQFSQDSVYAQRYHIRVPDKNKPKTDAPTDAETVELARELLMRARLINQRLSSLSRLITSLCAQQIDYLKSGDARQLKPLAQADLAREMGEHPSTVSRLIRNKTIETPWGRVPLLYLCQSKTDVVARLIGDFPKLTDQQMVSKLREEYDCEIARRTVAYHRGKRLRRNKRRQKSDS